MESTQELANTHHEWLHQNRCNTMFPRDMVCLRNISVDTLHKGDTEDNNNDNSDIDVHLYIKVNDSLSYGI